jgi:hypothetical protein
MDSLMEDVPRPKANFHERGGHGSIDGTRLLLQRKVRSVDVDPTGHEIGVGFGAVMNPHEVREDQVARPAQHNRPGCYQT